MKRLLLALIRFYRREISPRKRKPCCRYFPTCSQYAVTAMSRGGYDPVPEDPHIILRRE